MTATVGFAPVKRYIAPWREGLYRPQIAPTRKIGSLPATRSACVWPPVFGGHPHHSQASRGSTPRSGVMHRTAALLGVLTALALALVAVFAPSIAPSTDVVHVVQYTAVGVGATIVSVYTVTVGRYGRH